MPALTNPRHERFAQAIYEGMARGEAYQGRAYKAAGYKVTNNNSANACASRLLTYAKGIGARLLELQAEAAKRHQVTIQSIAAELEEARTLAAQEKQTSAMVAATTTKAKLHGLFVERTEQGKPGDFSTTNNSTELADRLIAQCNPNVIPTDELRAAVLGVQRESVERIAFLVDSAAQLEPGQPLPDSASLAH